MPFGELEELGTAADMKRRLDLVRVDDEHNQKKVATARNLILVQNHAISSNAVEAQLKACSLTPTAVSAHHPHTDSIANSGSQNAFSKRLAPLGFDIYSTLVVDLMHEFELGVWKGLFIHLLRILEAHSKASGYNSINELDRR